MKKFTLILILLFFSLMISSTSIVYAQSCYDSDNGLNYYTKGYVKFDNTIYYDNCINEKVLIEGYCDDGYFNTTTYYCPEKCTSGTCLSTQNLIWSEVWSKISPKISQIKVKSWKKPLKIEEVELPRIPKEEIYSRYVNLKYKISTEEAIKKNISLPEGFYETSDYLIGDIVTSLVYVQYDKGEWWKEQEIVDSFLNATAGLLWLEYYEPFPNINIEWNVTGDFAVIDVDPASFHLYDDEIWISKVMSDLGYDPSIYGVYEYIDDLRSEYQADWGFVIFMVRGSRFNDGPSAYARHWGPYVAIAVHEEVGMGYRWLMPTTAHETLHIFGAHDEYCNPGSYCCKCSSSENYFKIPNLNCEAGCFPGYEDNCTNCIWGDYCDYDWDCDFDEYCKDNRCKHWCLMSVEAPYICPVSQAQIGWIDCDSDGIWMMGTDCINNTCQVGEYEVCGSNCLLYTGSENCKGKIPGSSWCDGNIKKTCNSTCVYSYIDCKDYGPNYYCSGGICKPSGGGCPVLKAWDGNEFKNIGRLNIHSKEGVDTQYSTQFKMKPYSSNEYKLILQEKWYMLWEGSHIDYVSLKDSTGKECKLIKAVHSKLEDVTSLLQKSDDSRVETKPGQSIELTFADCKGNDFILEIEGYNHWWHFVKLGLSYTSLLAVIITLAILFTVIFAMHRLKKT